MDALCKYGSSKKIGLEIGMSEGTVVQHMLDIYGKMNCHNRVVAACIWQRWRIFDQPQP